VVIEVRGLHKVFRVPDQRIDSIKERVAHPFTRVHHREHHALRDVSFDVRQGEFFGIVGRNGSGKSSLLKILASIYGADAGSVRTAGRMAPFIELGVGVNPELTARENVELNGVLVGLTRREARGRLDAVMEFAELEEFVDLKLKNYSSGMLVRFAFAVMVQADADIMLIDEVLAVGDASFAQKCLDVFHERRRKGRTVVLVTHDMGTVEDLCHRAMVLHDGELVHIGAADSAAMRYLQLNFAGGGEGTADAPVVFGHNVRVVRARLLDAVGAPLEGVQEGDPLRLDLELEAARELDRPKFLFNVVNQEGVVIAEFLQALDARVPAGGRVRVGGEIENRLVAGRHYLDCWVREDREHEGMAVQAMRPLSFVVYGHGARHGIVSLRSDLAVELRP
jgi:ABC-2 type transport system ATP-binding protein